MTRTAICSDMPALQPGGARVAVSIVVNFEEGAEFSVTDVVEAEELDIRVHPQRHPGAAWPGQRRAAVDRDISKRTQ
jgi:hypothetical protein